MTVTALTTFLGKEGMWKAGESKKVDKLRGAELLSIGLVQEKEVEAPKVSTSTHKPMNKSRKPAEKREIKPVRTDLESK